MKKIKAKIDKFEGEWADVSTEYGNFKIPGEMLPDCREGGVVYISVATENAKNEDREEVARNLLNEVLKEE